MIDRRSYAHNLKFRPEQDNRTINYDDQSNRIIVFRSLKT